MAWYSQLMAALLPISDSVIFNICARANLTGLLHLDIRSKRSFLSDRFSNWKIVLCKTKGFNIRPRYVTNMQYLLKDSQKEEYRICLQKIVQSISYLSSQDIAFHMGKQDGVSNFMQRHLLCAEDDELFGKWI